MTSSSRSPVFVIGIVVLAAVLALVGITFFALAISGPIALVVADQIGAYVSASDAAIASQLASLWPLFVVASVASLVAALAAIVKLIQRVSPTPAA